MKPALVNQRSGLGDILFCEPLARHLLEKHGEVIWPVASHYTWVSDYIPNIKYVDSSDGFDWLHDLAIEEYTHNQNYMNSLSNKKRKLESERDRQHKNSGHWKIYNQKVLYVQAKIDKYLEEYDRKIQEEVRKTPYHIINLRFANHTGNPWECMRDKYRSLGLDPEMYRQFTWNRNTEKEEELYALLNPNDEPYNLINRNYEWPIKVKNIEVNNSMKNIYMDVLDGYTMFDWGKLIENASEIHTTSTSLCFIVEVLTRGTSIPIHLYTRSGDPSFRAVSFLEDRWLRHV